ncbi:MAG TPA: serine hydrolase [Candidatus Binatus sp.]|nr:serine hydrolase [Candidatus Binatus sp.]
MDVEELFSGICDRIPDAMAHHKVPGVALGIVCEGREFMKGFGVTNVRHPLPVDEKTLFQIGSTTKTFTATAVMRLVEAGKLALDEPVRRYLPDFRMSDPEVTSRLTTRHLLTHIGGWDGDFFPDTGNGDDAIARYVKLMAELPQRTPLGTILSYNNAGFSVAGRVIEVVTGKTFEAALKELVLDPIGLKRSFMFPTEVMTHRFAVGHATIADKIIVLRPWQLTRANGPAGGIAASMIDQLRYARFHLGDGTAEDGTRILTRESIAMMQTPGNAAMLDIKMGLAWMTRDIGGVRRVFHGGGTYGQLTAFTMTPARKFALALNTNSMSGSLLNLEVTRGLVARFLGNEEGEPAELPTTPLQMAEYSGRYTRTLGGDIEIKADGEKLMMQLHSIGGFPTANTPPGPTPRPFRIGLIGEDRIAMVEPAFKDIRGEFIRNPDGSIAWLRWGSRIHARA